MSQFDCTRQQMRLASAYLPRLLTLTFERKWQQYTMYIQYSMYVCVIHSIVSTYVCMQRMNAIPSNQKLTFDM
jgi:hypothetical protein